MKGDYRMHKKEFVKLVKRINERLNTYKKKLGEDNSRYQYLLNQLSQSNVPMHISASGNWAISTGQAWVNSQTNQQILSVIKGVERAKTYSAYIESRVEDIKEIFEQEIMDKYGFEVDMLPTDILAVYVSRIDSIHTLINENAELIYNVSPSLTLSLHSSNNLNSEDIYKLERIVTQGTSYRETIQDYLNELENQSDELYRELE